MANTAQSSPVKLKLPKYKETPLFNAVAGKYTLWPVCLISHSSLYWLLYIHCLPVGPLIPPPRGRCQNVGSQGLLPPGAVYAYGGSLPIVGEHALYPTAEISHKPRTPHGIQQIRARNDDKEETAYDSYTNPEQGLQPGPGDSNLV